MPATVDASSSNEPQRTGVLSAYLRLARSERLAALAALICAASLVLPWYRVSFSADLVETGLGAFSFAAAALLLTLAAALVLLLQVGRGRRPPLPLHEGTLLAAAGIWSALIVLYLMADRPQVTIGGFRSGYSLAYGIFVALGAALALGAAGLSVRRRELRVQGPGDRPAPGRRQRTQA